jgi:phenylacetate-CoA ligase
MTELPTLTRCGCARHEGALHLNEDFLLVECLEPGGDGAVAPGEPGELVFTNLLNDTQPVLRYRSGDIGRLSAVGRCHCGLPLRRLERSVEGRVDDMVWYHGVNLFPSAVEDAVRRLDMLRSDFRLVLRGRREWPELTVEVAPVAALDDAAQARLRGEVEAALQAALQVRPRVEIVEPERLEDGATSGKTRRILDLREAPPGTEGRTT